MKTCRLLRQLSPIAAQWRILGNALREWPEPDSNS